MRKPFNSDYPLTQSFGNRLIINGKDIYAQFGLKGHNGLDYGLPMSTEVVAPHSGIVKEATNDSQGYGNYLKIENDKEGSVLAHLKDFTINVGDSVTEGQVIAHSNNTGNSTAPHLHWGYYLFPRDRQNGYAGFIDQLPLLSAQPDNQALIDQLRTERDKNWDLYQSCLQKEAEYQKQINELQSANNTLNDKITTLNKAMAQDAINDSDTGKELLEVSRKLNDLQKEATDIAYAVGIAPYDFQEVLKAIAEANKPIEEAIKPIVKQRNELYDLLFEQGIGLYKKFRPKVNVFWKFIQEKLLKGWFR